MTKRQIFSLALFVYLLLAPFTYHPDIKTIFYQSQFFSQGFFNIYSFFDVHRDLAFLGQFVYPPLAYFIYGALFIPVKVMAGNGFVNWLAMGSDAVSVPHIFQYIFAMKLPAIIAFFVTGNILNKHFDSEVDQKKSLLLWFFNPISIYVVAFMSQIDSIAVLMTVLSLFCASKKPKLALVILGLGAAFKTYPLILIPFMALILGITWKKKLIYMFFGFVPYFLTILPFLKTPAFLTSTLVSGLSQRLFELRMSVGYGESILLVPAFLLILLLTSVTDKFGGIKKLPYFFFAATFVVVGGSHFHPQWSLWFLPFLIITVVKNSNLRKIDLMLSLIFLFVGWLGTIILFNDSFLTWGIISPLDPGILLLPPPSDLVKNYFDPLLLQGIFHTLMLTSGLYILFRTFDYEK